MQEKHSKEYLNQNINVSTDTIQLMTKKKKAKIGIKCIDNHNHSNEILRTLQNRTLNKDTLFEMKNST